MKIILILVAFTVTLFTACGQEAGADGSSDTPLPPVRDVIESADTANVLDGIDVNALCLMTIGEAIDILGQNHSKIKLFSDVGIRSEYRFEMVCQIEYEDSCVISFSKTDNIGDGYQSVPQTDLERNIEAITIHQEVEVWKGISVGKTLEEINKNPDLLNKLETSRDETDGDLSAECYYTYNDVLMFMTLEFDDDLKCTEIRIFTYGDSLL